MSDRFRLSVRRSLVANVFVLGVLCALAAPAAAQSNGKWEIEGHVGGAFGAQPSGGDAIDSFPAGAPFTTVPGLPSRRVASWMFGDGALMGNQIASGFTSPPVVSRIAPLDPVLKTGGLARQGGASFGLRFSRRLASRVSAEFALDSGIRSLELSDEVTKAIEATRASFAATWDGIMATGGPFFTNVAVTAATTVDEGDAHRQTVVTGALVFDIPMGRVTPYVTAGAGVRRNSGDLPAVTLRGNYQFRFLGAVPINETDLVVMHFDEARSVLVTVLGGGIRVPLSSRSGVRGDYRVRLSSNSVETLVDATPTEAIGTPSDVIWNGAVPVQFSNMATTRGNLSAPPIVNLKTFEGSGTDVQSSVSVGYYFRF